MFISKQLSFSNIHLIRSIDLNSDLSGSDIADKVNLVLHRMNKLGKKADILAHGVREHGTNNSFLKTTILGIHVIGIGASRIQGPLFWRIKKHYTF